ncbi:MAG: cobalamin B12-binding domain-containing protein [Verrucomicrobia bacterium]|nr:cobalamin B12-binding domain-containing protein [Verrucomicrobiota bacterium]
MNLPQLITVFSEALFDTDRERALRLAREAVNEGITPEEVVFDVVIPALEQQTTALGETLELNLAQHFLTSQIAAAVTEEMVSRFQRAPAFIGQGVAGIPRFPRAPALTGRVVIGSAQGDLHTLGKRIVLSCLRAQMIECSDLGVNVPPERFVTEAVSQQAPVIAISAMMVHTALGENGCLKVRQLLKEQGLEGRIKIIVGGAPFRFDPQLCQRIQADAWAEDGIKAGKVITKLFQEVRP